jgi:hypothetical protein
LAGRFFRFLILGFLTLRFGPQVVELGGRIVAHDFKWVLLALAVGFLGWLIWRRQAGKKKAAKPNANGTKMSSEENVQSRRDV